MEAPQHAGTERTGVSSAPAGEDAGSIRTVLNQRVRAGIGIVNSFHAEARREGESRGELQLVL
jgi:hypothetical protein